MILEMIPQEYWAQLQIELNSIDWQQFFKFREPPRPKVESADERRARVTAEYDERIKFKAEDERLKKYEMTRKSNRPR
ncbi:MAG: hypothetical protein LIP09_08050 [Bacteroidales bacterium]|nr:hypothetical protein [Bacteroidales bacterium]